MGDTVSFTTATKDDKLIIKEARLKKFNALSTLSWVTTGSFAALPFLLAAGTLNRSPIPLALYSTLSIISFAMIRADKIRAKKGAWRIPDNSLHLAHFFGGWPGTLIAQKAFNHKAHKKSFQGELNFIIFIHIVIWMDYLAMDHLLLRGLIKLLEHCATL
jgi:uncharacterized membrane protein YsdA (DUF1294 family)